MGMGEVDSDAVSFFYVVLYSDDLVIGDDK